MLGVGVGWPSGASYRVPLSNRTPESKRAMRGHFGLGVREDASPARTVKIPLTEIYASPSWGTWFDAENGENIKIPSPRAFPKRRTPGETSGESFGKCRTPEETSGESFGKRRMPGEASGESFGKRRMPGEASGEPFGKCRTPGKASGESFGKRPMPGKASGGGIGGGGITGRFARGLQCRFRKGCRAVPSGGRGEWGASLRRRGGEGGR